MDKDDRVGVVATRVAALELAIQYSKDWTIDEIVRAAEKFTAFFETGKVPGETDAKPDFVASDETLEEIHAARRGRGDG